MTADTFSAAERLRMEFDSVWPEREQHALGWLIVAENMDAAKVTANELADSDFIEPLHGRIFTQVATILREGRAPTVAELGALLADDPALLELHGTEYLQKLAWWAPDHADGKALAAAVRDTAARKAIAVELSASSEDALRLSVPIEETARRVDEANKSATRVAGRCLITARPYIWTPPELIPVRRPLFASRHATAGFVSVTGGAGGVGKSSLCLTECLAHCTGRNLLNDKPLFTGHSWLLALEDPMDEHRRRVAAAARLHKVDPEALKGRFFLNVRDQGFTIARDTRDGVEIMEPVVEAVISEIERNGITLLVVDPFVASHRVPENDNNKVDAVARTWARIAEVTGCAVELVHHLRKLNGNEPTIDDLRGASALAPVARSGRLTRTMTAEEGKKLAVAEHHRFFCVIDGKKNMGPRSHELVWRELMPIDLKNGNGGSSDWVAAVGPWRAPDATESVTAEQLDQIKVRVRSKPWRADKRAKEWVGNAVAEVLGYDLADADARAGVDRAIETWLRGGTFRRVDGEDRYRHATTFVEVADP